jgi:hypothetical protein
VTDDHLPALFRAADASSLDAQTLYRRTTAAILALLVVAAVGGSIDTDFGPGSTDWGGVVSALAFIVSILLQAFAARTRLERSWYAGRALAESSKSLAWQYAVAGGRYPEAHPEPDRALTADLRALLNDLGEARPFETGGGDPQITPRMRDLRGAPLAERRAAYRAGRIGSQRDWYSDKAQWNRRRARLWLCVTLGFQVAGGVGAVLKATGVIELDVLGIASAIAVAAIAWSELKDHSTLEEAYSLASHELSLVDASIDDDGDGPEWADLVGDAENAISREHRMWRAARSRLR